MGKARKVRTASSARRCWRRRKMGVSCICMCLRAKCSLAKRRRQSRPNTFCAAHLNDPGNGDTNRLSMDSTYYWRTTRKGGRREALFSSGGWRKTSRGLLLRRDTALNRRRDTRAHLYWCSFYLFILFFLPRSRTGAFTHFLPGHFLSTLFLVSTPIFLPLFYTIISLFLCSSCFIYSILTPSHILPPLFIWPAKRHARRVAEWKGRRRCA
jgi:hypothetical protein